MPIPSPFHPHTAPHVESHEWRDWGGILSASTYEPSHEREYFAIRNAAALIDVSPLFKYEVRGPQALQAVDRTVTRLVSRTDVGRVLYTPWCDDDGKVIDDGTVHRLAQDHFRITSAEHNLAWLQDCAFGLDAQVVDVTDELAALALQGPNARSVLKLAVGGADWDRLKYYRFAHGYILSEVEGESQHRGEPFPVTVSRTGYTGDLGYELWVAPQHAASIWEALMQAGQGFGLLPAGIVALDIARIEAGLIMLQVDYVSARHALIEEQKSSPFELGLSWAVDLDKPAFVGRKALLEEKRRGSTWALVGLEVDWDSLQALFAVVGLTPQVTGRASRGSAPVYQGQRQVGYATSHAFSPILKKYVALASLEREAAQIGARLEFEVTVEHVRRRASARVVELPFYNPLRKRALYDATHRS
jgi:aminomethyltransferase